MSKEERDFWLEMHKEELEEEDRKELEEKMLDDESQAELKKLAESIRSRRLAVADKEIRKVDDAAKLENERAKHDADKAGKSEKAEIESVDEKKSAD